MAISTLALIQEGLGSNSVVQSFSAWYNSGNRNDSNGRNRQNKFEYMINYDGKAFTLINNTENGHTGANTIFHYRQKAQVVSASYIGGTIQDGHLMGTVAEDGIINMYYHHVTIDGRLMIGQCISTPEILPDGRIRLYESWQWLNGDRSSGSSMIEEIRI